MCSNRYINNSFNNNNTTANFDDETLGTSGYSSRTTRGTGATNYSLPSNLRYGSAYVPVQTFRTVYSPVERIILWNNVSRACKNLLSKSIFI